MSEVSTSQAPLDVPYATPAPSYGHKVVAGIAIVIAGLGLVVLGGCFLIGVMLVTNHGFTPQMAGAPLSLWSIVLICVLYLLAGTALVCAAVVIVSGLRALFRVLRG